MGLRNNKIFKLYQELYKKYGKPREQWKLWCKRPKTKREKEKVIIGAILTQRTNWKNVELALTNLKRINKLSLKSIYNLGINNPKKLTIALRPVGFYQNKAHYLLGIARFFKKNSGLKALQKQPWEKSRETLLNLKGIGPETADSILLYAFDKSIFVIDEYTRRLVKKKKLSKRLSYNYLQKLFQKYLPNNYKLYQDFHALIVIDGKNYTG